VSPYGATSVAGDTCTEPNNYTSTCGGLANSPDIMYAWTAPATGTAVFSTCGGASYDTVLHARTVANDPGTQITCLDDFCGVQTEISFSVTAGLVYYVVVDGFSSGSCGPFTLTITNP
jgi:hypothetical protein